MLKRSPLADAREYLERALSCATTRLEERELGERVCELIEMQELEECRQLRLVKRRTHRQGVAFPVDVSAA